MLIHVIKKKGFFQNSSSSLLGQFSGTHVTICAIWYHLYNLAQVKNIFDRVALLVYHSSMGAFHVF